MYELRGSRVIDLLRPAARYMLARSVFACNALTLLRGSNEPSLSLRIRSDGSVQVDGSTSVVATSAAQLETILRLGLKKWCVVMAGVIGGACW